MVNPLLVSSLSGRLHGDLLLHASALARRLWPRFAEERIAVKPEKRLLLAHMMASRTRVPGGDSTERIGQIFDAFRQEFVAAVRHKG